MTTKLSHLGLPEPQFEFYPATKEQRDILMKAMADAGYTFDFEKKELRKIEQKLVEEANGEDYGIDGLYAAMDILNKTLGQVEGYQSDDGILEHKAAMTAVRQLYKQKHVEWSEEDEEKINKLLQFVQNIEDFQAIPNHYKQYKDMLKSLRPQHHWKPSDEQMKALNEAIYHVDDSVATQIAMLIGELSKL